MPKLYHFSQKHAHRFVPLPYQPENSDRGGGHPACRRASASSQADKTLAPIKGHRKWLEALRLRAFFPGGRMRALHVRQDARRTIALRTIAVSRKPC
ncbi:MAG: hypothetical protein IH623_16855 [Verrucomicrobia bacterium]|nr:hypothetical protein [Verrucomicrobiota bacterium]